MQTLGGCNTSDAGDSVCTVSVIEHHDVDVETNLPFPTAFSTPFRGGSGLCDIKKPRYIY